MSGITFLNRITGASNNLVYMETTDTTATATAAGYITTQAATITAITEGGWTWETNDVIMLSASDGVSWCSINSTFTTLTPFASDIVPLPASATNGLTAHSGGGQTNATALPSTVNRVTTVAASGDSVVLPAAAPGLRIIVINNGANPMQVYGLGSDTINAQTSSVGVSQMPNSVVSYVSAVAGLWESNEVAFGYADGNLFTVPFKNSITAHSGGGQSSAVALSAVINVVTTVAAAGDSVKLPVSNPGMEITVVNSGANALQIYGAGTDTINGVATATGIPQAAGAVVTYRCVAAGNWVSNQTTKGTGTVSTNAVTINAPAGEITTGSLTTASGSDATAITFTNSFISATSVVLCTINGGTNTTNGVTVKAVPGAGSATLTITNGNVAAAALNGTLIIGFQVI